MTGTSKRLFLDLSLDCVENSDSVVVSPFLEWLPTNVSDSLIKTNLNELCVLIYISITNSPLNYKVYLHEHCSSRIEILAAFFHFFVLHLL